jgi:hypothetical protein
LNLERQQPLPEATATAAQPLEKPKENLGFFNYAVNFTKGLIMDNKFWSRFNAIPNGVIFIAQGVGGAILLVSSAPVAAQVVGLAGCAVLAGVGLYGIGYGFPRAWQSMEALCARTFPKFNPPKAVREPAQKLMQKFVRTKLAQKIANSPLMRFKPHLKTERQQDVFLAGLTIEGATASGAAVAWAIAPHVMALPAITLAGGLAMAGAVWVITTCVFDVYSSAKTVYSACRDWYKERKAKKQATKDVTPAPQPQPQPAPAPQPLPAAMTPAFNKQAEAAPPAAPTTPVIPPKNLPPKPASPA